MKDTYQFGQHYQKVLLGLVLRDPKFVERYGDLLRREYFDNPAYGHLLTMLLDYTAEYRRSPSVEILPDLVLDYGSKLKLSSELSENLMLALMDALQVDLSDSAWVLTKAKEFAQFQEFRLAVVEAAKLLQSDPSQPTYEKIVLRVRKAIEVGANRDAGLNLKEHGAQLQEFIHQDSPFSDSRRVATGITRLDNALLGGLGPGELGVIMAKSGGGKLLADSTPVLTTLGWKTHGSLVPGDYVFGLDGLPTKVLAVGSPMQANVRVEFQNGEIIYCHEDHEWVLHSYGRDKKITLETSDLLDGKLLSPAGTVRYHLPTRGAITYPTAELSIHPYALGAWLGDGVSTAPVVTTQRRDLAIVDRISDFGHSISTSWVHKTTGVVSTSFGSGTRGKMGSFRQALLGYDLLGSKHIPTCYKEASVDQRLLLLAGLVDTDGYVCGSKITISTVSERLASDICEVVTSLGWNPWTTRKSPRLSTSGIQGKRTTIEVGFVATVELPVTLPRKKNVPKGSTRRVGVKSVVTDPRGYQGKCIQVAATDGVYLAGRSLVPTHNSMILSSFSAEAHRRGHSVYYFTLELNATDVLVRICSSLTGVPITDIVQDSGPAIGKFRSDIASFEARPNNIFVKYYTIRSVGVNGLKSYLSYMTTVTGVPPGLIVVDYADLLWTGQTSYNSAEKSAILGVVYEELRALGDSFGCPIWTASQTVRESWRSAEEGGLIDMEDAAESVKKMHAADLVLTASSTRKEREQGRVKLYTAKVRRGESGYVIDCLFDPSRARLTESTTAVTLSTHENSAHTLESEGDRINLALGRG